MGRLIDCQMAFVTWGVKARFRQGKLSLLRKGSQVYLALFFTSTEYYKLPVDNKTLQLLPAAIRFKNIGKDLFVRRVANEEQYETMRRGIKVLLRKDELIRQGKGDKLDKFIADIPTYESIKLCDRTPVRVTARLINTSADSNVAVGATDSNRAGKVVGKLADGYEAAKRLDNPHLRCIKSIGVHDISVNFPWTANSLTSVSLIDCKLTFVPKELEMLAHSLTFLDLSRNSINKLPRTICCKLNNVTDLNLSHNLIETLPLEIKFFSRLVDLNISNNRLRLLPSTFSDLRSLKTLNVANNNLSQLPAFRKDDIRLTTLDISMNPLDGALAHSSTFEVYPSFDDNPLGYEEASFTTFTTDLATTSKKKPPTLFEISMLNVVRDDFLFKLASEESLPKSIVSIMQRDVFKCYRCNRMNMLPAYNSTDHLDYVEQVQNLITTRNFSVGMTFMKLLCRSCFGFGSSRN